MPIPDLDNEGFLPEGVHESSLEEIREKFGRFQRSDKRLQLYRKLNEFMDAAKRTSLIAFVIVDGSFIGGKDEPSDIDLVLVLHRNHDWAAELRPFEYNVVSRRSVRKGFGLMF